MLLTNIGALQFAAKWGLGSRGGDEGRGWPHIDGTTEVCNWQGFYLTINLAWCLRRAGAREERCVPSAPLSHVALVSKGEQQDNNWTRNGRVYHMGWQRDGNNTRIKLLPLEVIGSVRQQRNVFPIGFIVSLYRGCKLIALNGPNSCLWETFTLWHKVIWTNSRGSQCSLGFDSQLDAFGFDPSERGLHPLCPL